MANDFDNFLDDTTLTVGIKESVKEGIVTERDSLNLDLDDKKFVTVVDKLIDDSRKFFADKGVYSRREKNLQYYLGQQIKDLENKKEFKEYNAKYIDNIIYESEATLKPIALSRVPELIVTPGSNSEESKATAKKLSEVVNTDLKKRENRVVLGRSYRHRPIFFIGVIKYLWNPELGRNGDYEFQSIHPDDIDIDHTAKDNDVSKMDWVAHHYDLTVKQAFMKFPDKKSDLIKELGWGDKDVENELKLATKIKITEFWFTWYEKAKKAADGSNQWEKIEATAWKYKTTLLKRMRNPNWDWEGETVTFSYDEANEKINKISEDQIKESFDTGQEIPNTFQRKIYHNHFEQPEKPFIFVGYDQLGKMPYDETSRIEQVLYLQDNVDKRGKQITELADGAKGKNVFSTDSGLSKKDIELIDMNNPNQDILVTGDLNDVWKFIPGSLPTQALFQDQEINRDRIFSKMGANAASRGERQPQEPATGTQILREADFGKADDEVEDTINYAALRMANAAMQMIKLRYTKDHLKKVLGKDGEVIFNRIKRDLVEDGVEVEVSASGVDKIMRKKEAYDRAGIQMTDPLSFFQDTDATDPKGRTEKLLIFQMGIEQYLEKYIKERDTQQQIDTLNGPQQGAEQGAQAPPQGQEQQGGGGQKVVMDLAMLMQGQQPQPPQQVDAVYVQAITKFMQSQQYQSLSPEVKQKVDEYAGIILQMAKQQEGGQTQQAQPEQAQPPVEQQPV